MIFSVEYLRSITESQNSNKDNWLVKVAKSQEFSNYRAMLEKYYKIIPDNCKSDYLKELRSRNFKSHRAYSNELIAYALLEYLNLQPIFQPIINGQKPDLKIKDVDDIPIIIEVLSHFNKSSIEELDKIGWRWVSPYAEGVINSVNHKRKKYKEISASGFKFIILIFNEAFPELVEDKLESSLFGNYIWDPSHLDSNQDYMIGRERRGTFRLIADGKPKNTSISGLLYVEKKGNVNNLEYCVHLYHNPAASKPIHVNLFSRIPQLVFEIKDGEYIGQWALPLEMTINLNSLV